MLPKSTFPPSLLKHFFSYYDRRFEQTQSFAHLFLNRLMRRAAIRKIARVESTNKKHLENLGSLMKREDFKKALHDASRNPHSKKSKLLNNELTRLLSFVAKELPFSTFERSQSKAKFSSMSTKHGFKSSFMTITPPEQDDLCLLKLHLIRNSKNHNGRIGGKSFDVDDFKWEDLPEELRNSPRQRLFASQKIPA